MTEVTREPDIPSAGEVTWLRRPFVSLTHSQFRLFWFSNLIVSAGLMMQFTARGWLTVQLTDSALFLGAVEGVWALTFAMGSIPMGVVADRMNRRNLLIAGSSVALAAAAIVGVLAAMGTVAVWHLIVTGGIGGVLGAARMPAGQAMTARLVPTQRLMNAMSLNQTAHSLPNVAGPAAGGVLIAAIGIAGAYFFVSGAFFVGLLLMLGVAASFGSIARRGEQGVRGDLRDAFEYLKAHKELLTLTAAILVPFVLGQSYILLLPLFVEQELGMGPEAFGALSACVGAGSVAGGLAVATFGEERRIGFVMFLGAVGIGLGAVAYGLSQSVYITAAVLLIAGAAQSSLLAAYGTLLVVRLPDEMRGRVMGLMFTLVALFPVGVIAAGGASDLVGLRAVAVVEGVTILAVVPLAWVAVFRGLGARGPGDAP